MSYFQIVLVIVMAFIVSVIGTSLSIPILQQRHTGQSIREEGPKSHQVKAGTPTMGGIPIIVGMFFALAVTKEYTINMFVMFGVLLLFGALGFLDDYIKVTKKHNLGLRAWQKFLLQTVIAVLLAVYMSKTSVYGTTVFIPIFEEYFDLGIWYIPFIAFVVVAMTNSVNLTDGLDGLAGGVTSIVALYFAIVAFMFKMEAPMLFCAAITGACLGFLVYNRHPARIFMGDTGSLALGGGLAAAAIMMNMELLLPIAGFVFVIEALSVIIQVISFKTTGKRIFKMAPLHHHFELCGMKESQVVGLFWFAALLCCVIGIGIV